MTYIGLSPPNTFTKSTSQTFTGNGSTTAFTLQTRVASPEDLEVFVSNVQQQPTESYTIGSDGVTMTFSEAPPSGTFYVIYRTVAQQAGTDTGASRLIGDNTFTGNQSITGDLTVTSTDAGASSDPSLILFRNSASPADQDLTGQIFFRGRNDNNQDVEFAEIRTKVTDVSDGSEDANFELLVNQNGSLSNRLTIKGNGVSSFSNQDLKLNSGVDLLVNGNEIKLDADDDTSITADTDDQIDLKVGGIDTLVVKPDVVEIKGSHPDLKLMDTDDNNYGGLFYNNGAINLASDHDATGATGKINFVVDGSTKATILAGGNVGIGITDPSHQLHIESSGSNTYATMKLEGQNRGGQIDFFQNTVITNQILGDQSGNLYIGSSGGFGQVALDSQLLLNSTNKAFSIKNSTFLTQLADDAQRSIVANGQGIIIVTSYNLGLTCIARHEYQNIVQIISANSLWSNTDTDGKICLISGTNDYSINLKNRYGSALSFKALFVGTYQ